MVEFSAAKTFDMKSLDNRKGEKTEIRKRMEALSVGMGFSVSGEEDEVKLLIKSARYAASNIPARLGTFRVLWEEKGVRFAIIRLK